MSARRGKRHDGVDFLITRMNYWIERATAAERELAAVRAHDASSAEPSEADLLAEVERLACIGDIVRLTDGRWEVEGEVLGVLGSPTTYYYGRGPTPCAALLDVRALLTQGCRGEPPAFRNVPSQGGTIGA